MYIGILWYMCLTTNLAGTRQLLAKKNVSSSIHPNFMFPTKFCNNKYTVFLTKKKKEIMYKSINIHYLFAYFVFIFYGMKSNETTCIQQQKVMI